MIPTPEQKLWWAVLLQAVQDLWLKEIRTKGLTGVRRNAEDFIFHSDHFSLVCCFAGTDPEWFRNKVRRLMQQHPYPTKPSHIFDKVETWGKRRRELSELEAGAPGDIGCSDEGILSKYKQDEDETTLGYERSEDIGSSSY